MLYLEQSPEGMTAKDWFGLPRPPGRHGPRKQIMSCDPNPAWCGGDPEVGGNVPYARAHLGHILLLPWQTEVEWSLLCDVQEETWMSSPLMRRHSTKPVGRQSPYRADHLLSAGIAMDRVNIGRKLSVSYSSRTSMLVG